MLPEQERNLLTDIELHDIAEEMLDPEERDLLSKYYKEVERLRKLRGMKDRENIPDDLYEEAQQNIPGSKEVEDRCIEYFEALKTLDKEIDWQPSGR